MDQYDFTKYISELDTPQVADYEFFTRNETAGYSFEIYRKYAEDSKLYYYKCYGELKDISPERVNDVYHDLEYRKQWDSYCHDLRITSETSEEHIIYWRVAYPWPMSHRDYVFHRRSRILEERADSPKRWCIIGRNTDDGVIDEVKGVVRVNQYEQTMTFQGSESGKGTKVFLYYFDNPGGALPTWMINWAAKTGVPNFMGTLQKACEQYTKNN